MKKITLLIAVMIASTGVAHASDGSPAIVEMVKAGANPVAARCAVSGYDNLTTETCENAAKIPNAPQINQQMMQSMQMQIDQLNNQIQLLSRNQQDQR